MRRVSNNNNNEYIIMIIMFPSTPAFVRTMSTGDSIIHNNNIVRIKRFFEPFALLI